MALVKEIIARHDISLENIRRHSDIDERTFECGGKDVKTKQDPGKAFPWGRFIESIAAEDKQCYLLTSGTPPSGFGAAYNVLSKDKKLLLRTTCMDRDAVINVGSGISTQYVYRQGYELKNDAWVKFDLEGGELVANDWYVGEAFAQLTRTPAELAQINYFLAYVCIWTGNEWKCGCRDSGCNQSFWQLQEFQQRE